MYMKKSWAQQNLRALPTNASPWLRACFIREGWSMLKEKRLTNVLCCKESPPGKRPISYLSNVATPNVIGSQEIYNDPRQRREAVMRR